ncbi:MAG TPA: hypothetical protein VL181_04340, partial [Holophagaceae bacterium]|nr:hypothetical protein [Holophagaceae bacterium]
MPRSAARVELGRIRHLEAHLERLSRSAAALGASVPWLPAQAGPIRDWVAAFPRAGAQALRLRLHGDQVW